MNDEVYVLVQANQRGRHDVPMPWHDQQSVRRLRPPGEGEILDNLAVEGPPHPIDALRAARRDLLAALQSHTAADLLRPGVEGDWCGRDVLLHIAAWLRELARLVPDLATYGYQRGAPCDPGPDWAAWNAAQIALHRTVRPEAAVAGVVTAHARLLDAVEGLDDAGLRRRGPTRFAFVTSGWDLLLAEAAHEREHAARLVGHTPRPALALDAPCRPPNPVLRAG
jgi:DinB superfamily